MTASLHQRAGSWALTMGLLGALLVLAPALAEDDDLPPEVEMLMCGNGATRAVTNAVGGATGLGSCAETGDFEPTPFGENVTNTPANAQDLVDDVDDDPANPDHDLEAACAFVAKYNADVHDAVCGEGPDADPQALHDALCDIENSDDDADGSCADPDGDGNETYSPPGVPQVPGTEPVHNAICDNVEDPADPADGSCADPDGDGNQTYTPPALPGSLDEAMCGNDAGWQGLEDPATANDGSCNEEGVYTLPGGVDPDGVLAGLHCSRSEDPVTLVESIRSDYDCDGDGNIPELLAGCDPTDPESNPTTPGTCDGPGDVPPESPICSDEEPGVGLVEDLASDADCDGDGNLNDDDPLTPG